MGFISLLLFELQQVNIRNTSHYKLSEIQSPNSDTEHRGERRGTCYHWLFLWIL